MPIYHATLIFTQAPLGWVEQFYRTDVSLQSALAAGLSLATARYSCVGAGVGIARLRVSEVGFAHNSLAAVVPGRPVSAVAISPFVRAMIRMASVGPVIHRRSYVMGGLPASAIIGGPGLAIWSGPYGVAAQAWLAMLISQGWQIQVWQPLGPPLPLVGVTEGVTVGGDIFGGPLADAPDDDPLNYLFAQTADTPPLGGTLLHITGAKVSPNFPQFRRRVNGNYPLLSYLPNGVTYASSFGAANYVGGGKLVIQQVQYLGISQASLTRTVARKCGPARLDVDATPLPAPVVNSIRRPTGPLNLPVASQNVPYIPVQPTLTFQTLKHVCDAIFNMYLDLPAPSSDRIAVAQVVGTEKPTYIWFVTGIDVNTLGQTFTQWWAAITSYLGFPDTYTSYLRKLIQENTPDGCDLILCGHSMGGFAIQQADNLGALGNRRVIRTIGFGTAGIYSTYGGLLDIPAAPPNVRLFSVRNDPVPWLTPGGNWFWVSLILGAASEGAVSLEVFLANQIFPIGQLQLAVPPGVGLFDFVRRHNIYPACPDIAQWNWNGTLDPDQKLPPLDTGPITYFVWPPP